MIAKNAIGKKLNDSVFIATGKAKDAIEKYGKENVINATIGALYGENEELVALDVVENTYKNMNGTDLFAYAPKIDGSPKFKDGVARLVLGDDYQEYFKNIGVVGTSGGTGAIKNSLKNYLNIGEKVLLPSLMWGSYKVIAREIGGDYATYNLFTEDGNFDIPDFKKQVLELMKTQESVVIIINDPCHNPTGYSLSLTEWEEILNFLNECSDKKNIILINDIAYSNFSNRDEVEHRKLFKNLNKNLLLIFAYSMSKAFTAYGLRGGAQIAVSQDKNTIDEFLMANQYSCRASWSNMPRGVMTLLETIVSTPEKYDKMNEETEFYRDLLKERSNIFVKEADEVGLNHYPYRDGFFITIPVNDVEKSIENLEKNNIFVVPLSNSLRVGLCSVPVKKVYGLASKIKECIK